MQIFTIHDLWIAAQSGVAIFWELKGIIASEALQLVILPFHEFSITSCLVSMGGLIILWKNKTLIFSGLSHVFHIADWFIGLTKGLLLWLRVQ